MDTTTPAQAALDLAVKTAGGLTALMRALNERGHTIGSHQVIRQWHKTRVPANYCPDIEELTGVACEELRGDVRWRVLRKTDRKVAARLRAIELVGA